MKNEFLMLQWHVDHLVLRSRFSPGYWEIPFRPMGKSVSSAYNLLGILNFFVFGKKSVYLNNKEIKI